MRKFMVFIFIITFGSAVHSAAQECGPGCPICSGSGSSTGAILPSGTLVFSTMSIPTGEDETAVFNLRAGVTAWLDVGLVILSNLIDSFGVFGGNPWLRMNHHGDPVSF